MTDIRPGYCIEIVLAGGRWLNAHQCPRKAKFDQGTHCKQHSEAGVEARRTAWERRYAEDRARADALDRKRAEDRHKLALFDDLLMVLRDVAKLSPAEVIAPTLRGKIDAAIAKAEGGTP